MSLFVFCFSLMTSNLKKKKLHDSQKFAKCIYQTEKVCLGLFICNNQIDMVTFIGWGFNCYHSSGGKNAPWRIHHHTMYVCFLKETVNKRVLFLPLPWYTWPQRDHLRWFIPFHLSQNQPSVPKNCDSAETFEVLICVATLPASTFLTRRLSSSSLYFSET